MTRYPLRRSDRALSPNEALAALDAAQFVTVSTVDDDGEPYGVPLSFTRTGDTLYFHAASEGGHKTDNFRRDARACATAVVDVQPFFEDGDFTTSYRSAIARGRIREVEDTVEFKHALVSLCMKYVPEAKHGIGAAMEHEGPNTAVWALDIDELSGKIRPHRASDAAESGATEAN